MTDIIEKTHVSCSERSWRVNIDGKEFSTVKALQQLIKTLHVNMCRQVLSKVFIKAI